MPCYPVWPFSLRFSFPYARLPASLSVCLSLSLTLPTSFVSSGSILYFSPHPLNTTNKYSYGACYIGIVGAGVAGTTTVPNRKYFFGEGRAKLSVATNVQLILRHFPIVSIAPFLATTSKKLEFQAETRQLLDIVTHSIYTDKEVFLRELISNASDAMEKLRHLQVIGGAIEEGSAPSEIIITTDEKEKTITIQDTVGGEVGTGEGKQRCG